MNSYYSKQDNQSMSSKPGSAFVNSIKKGNIKASNKLKASTSLANSKPYGKVRP